MIESLQLFAESWELLGNSVLAGMMAGCALGMMGVYLVLRRMVFLSAALSQTASLGVTLAFFAQVQLGAPGWLASPTAGSVACVALVVAMLMLDRSADAERRDALLGVTFLLGAAGTLVLGTRIVQEIADVESLLFGSAVAVVPERLALLAATLAITVAIHLWWRRGFVALLLDATDARVRGLPVRMIDGVFLLTTAVAIAVTSRVLGALPAFAFSVLPALLAIRVSRTFTASMVIGAALGAICALFGYFFAFAWDLPVGPAQTLCAVSLAVVALLPARR